MRRFFNRLFNVPNLQSVDFYLRGNDSPWAWGECKKFTQRDKYVEFHYDYPDRITTGYY